MRNIFVIIFVSLSILLISFSAPEKGVNKSSFRLYMKNDNGTIVEVSHVSLLKIWQNQLKVKEYKQAPYLYVKNIKNDSSNIYTTGVYAKFMLEDKAYRTPRIIEVGTKVIIYTNKKIKKNLKVDSYVLHPSSFVVTSYCSSDGASFGVCELEIVADGYKCAQCVDSNCKKVGTGKGQTWEQVYQEALDKNIISKNDFH